jgi:RNA 3'-terminal phosphate cyclase (ATP)
VGEYLADQLLLPLALAGGGAFRTLRPTRHTTTNTQVLQKFLDIPVVCEQHAEDDWIIRLGACH